METPIINFQWTDDLVKEFIWFTFAPSDPNHAEVNSFMEKFKQSKQALQPMEVEIPDFEIIEYKVDGSLWEKRMKDNVTSCITDESFMWSRKYGAGYMHNDTMDKSTKEINAIRRTEDNGIFSVGDDFGEGYKITRFKIEDGIILHEMNDNGFFYKASNLRLQQKV